MGGCAPAVRTDGEVRRPADGQRCSESRRSNRGRISADGWRGGVASRFLSRPGGSTRTPSRRHGGRGRGNLRARCRRGV